MNNQNNLGAHFIASFIAVLQLCLSCSIILVAYLVNCTEGQSGTIDHSYLAHNHGTTEQVEQAEQMEQTEHSTPESGPTQKMTPTHRSEIS
jgi:hypothetical protein